MSLLLCALTACEVAAQQTHAAGSSTLNGVSAAELRALPPLPKVHYSFPIAGRLLDPLHPAVREYVRITHAISVNPRYHSERHVKSALELCQRINECKPALPASLAVTCSPYHSYRPGPTDFGELHRKELAEIRVGFRSIRRWVDEFNRDRNATMDVTMVILDCERFLTTDNQTRAAVIRKYDEVYDLAKQFFPKATVEWYNRGKITKQEHSPQRAVNWIVYPRFSTQEKGDAFSCSLYCLPEIGYTRETFERTRQHARENNLPVHVWIALASGYRRDLKSRDGQRFELDWDYDPVYSWFAGFEANRRWDAAAVLFYPAPFDARVKQWGKHFLAYVKGAHGQPL